MLIYILIQMNAETKDYVSILEIFIYIFNYVFYFKNFKV